MKTNVIIERKLKHKKKSVDDLAQAIFGEVTKNTQTKTRNILNGSTERMTPEWVVSICTLLDITPNELFPKDQVGGSSDLGCW